MPVPDPTDVLSAMITPAVLISACGTLTLSTSNRLARVVERVRKLTAAADDLSPPAGTADDEASDKRELVVRSLGKLVRRVGLLQSALFALYTAVGLLVASSLCIGLSGVLERGWRWLPVGLGLLGALAQFVACVQLLREVRLAVRTIYLETDYARRLIARRTGVPANQKP